MDILINFIRIIKSCISIWNTNAISACRTFKEFVNEFELQRDDGQIDNAIYSYKTTNNISTISNNTPLLVVEALNKYFNTRTIPRSYDEKTNGIVYPKTGTNSTIYAFSGKWNTSTIPNTFADNTSLIFVEHLDLSNATVITHLFRSCSSLKYIDDRNLNLSKVVKLSNPYPNNLAAGSQLGPFGNCSSLISLNLSSLSVVRNMCQCFSGCSSLKKLSLGDLSNIKKVTSMSADCYNGMYQTFINCSSLEDFTIINSPHCDWSLYWSPLLTAQSILNVVNSLYDFRTDETEGQYWDEEEEIWDETHVAPMITFNSSCLATISSYFGGEESEGYIEMCSEIYNKGWQSTGI